MEKILAESSVYKEEELIWIGEDYSTTVVHVLPNPSLKINSVKDFPDLFCWLPLDY